VLHTIKSPHIYKIPHAEQDGTATNEMTNDVFTITKQQIKETSTFLNILQL